MKILDCTLRDGGYYTNWDFDSDLVKVYFESFNQLPIDYIEVGYRSNPQREYLGEFFYCRTILLEKIKTFSNKSIAIMLNEKDINRNDLKPLLDSCKGLVKLIRIAVNPENFLRASGLAEGVKKLGFEVGFNVMYMSKWSEFAIMKDLPAIDGTVDYLYLVDSFGGVYPQDVIGTISMVREKSSIPIGFHGHNNLELALINSLTAIENGAEIVDSTVTGMGRGAGNLKTELLLTSLSNRSGLHVDFNSLGKVVSSFESLREQHGWGTNLPYMISGSTSLPQKDVMEWVTRRYYSFNSIIRALQNQKAGVVDNEKLPFFSPGKKYQKVIVIGGGLNGERHSEAVAEYILQCSGVCIVHASSKNAGWYKNLKVDQFFCLVGNEGHRLESVFHYLDEFQGVCVLPPYPRKMGTYFPNKLRQNCFELKEISIVDKYKDSHTALAIQTAIVLGASELLFVGYDGYTGQKIDQREQELFLENEYIFSEAMAKGIRLCSLTPTKYGALQIMSIYSLLK